MNPDDQVFGLNGILKRAEQRDRLKKKELIGDQRVRRRIP